MYTCSVRIVPHDSWIVFSDELRTEILSLMYNVATLQDGVENIHEFCPSLISLSMQALRKTHSDPLRTNCVGPVISVRRSIGTSSLLLARLHVPCQALVTVVAGRHTIITSLWETGGSQTC